MSFRRLARYLHEVVRLLKGGGEGLRMAGERQNQWLPETVWELAVGGDGLGGIGGSSRQFVLFICPELA